MFPPLFHDWNTYFIELETLFVNEEELEASFRFVLFCSEAVSHSDKELETTQMGPSLPPTSSTYKLFVSRAFGLQDSVFHWWNWSNYSSQDWQRKWWIKEPRDQLLKEGPGTIITCFLYCVEYFRNAAPTPQKMFAPVVCRALWRRVFLPLLPWLVFGVIHLGINTYWHIDFLCFWRCIFNGSAKFMEESRVGVELKSSLNKPSHTCHIYRICTYMHMHTCMRIYHICIRTLTHRHRHTEVAGILVRTW